jgi:hypothetical protein
MNWQRGDRGQASVEVIAGAVAVLLAGLIGLQLLGAGYAAVMADHATESAALAIATGADPRRAARSAVPGWPAHSMRVRRRGGQVRVTLVPPSLFGALGRRLAITSEANVRPPRGG